MSVTPPEAPPYPSTPEDNDAANERKGPAYTDVLTFQWAFGFNRSLPVLNVSINNTKKLFFAAAQIGVLYDFANNRQQLLIGHRNNITSCCISNDKRWLCTADSGQDCTIIIWDTITGVPTQTYFDVINGTVSMAFSSDAKYLASLSNGNPQIVSIWDWTNESDRPECALELKHEHSNQHHIQFNPRQSFQLVSNSTTQVLFYEWSHEIGLVCFDPELNEQTFNTPRERLGFLTQSVFLLHPTKVITATTTGKLVLWDYNGHGQPSSRQQQMLKSNETFGMKRQGTKMMNIKESTHETLKTMNSRLSSDLGENEEQEKNNLTQSFEQDEAQLRQTLEEFSMSSVMNKKPLKLCEPQKKSITVLSTSGDLIVTGDTDGIIRFFDQELKLRMWFEHYRIGPIESISFTSVTSDYSAPSLPVNVVPKHGESTLEQPAFSCLNFTISSSDAVIAYVTHSGSNISIVKRDSPSGVYALDTHPFEHKLCFANVTGRLELWDYEEKLLIKTAQHDENNPITRIRYNHNGGFIAVGHANGQLALCDALSLESVLKAPFHYAKAAIIFIEFSETSTYLATAEDDYTVSVYRQNLSSDDNYTFLGRYRAHYKPIRTLFFGFTPDDNQPILITIGADRILAEYDLDESEIDHLVLKPLSRVEQIAEPLSACYYPSSLTKESFILTINNEYKYKLHNADTKMCRRTVLGPTFGSTLRKISVLPKVDETSSEEYIYFMTRDKIGLQRLPLTGNPYDQMAVIAHPHGVHDIRASFDGQYLFTSGGTDMLVHMLSVNPQVLQAQAQLGGKDLIPFYQLLEGGREGEIFREMQDLFYYSQLRSQDINRFDQREVTPKIQISEIPFVMRALGFYPTEQEIEDMLNEVKFSKYVETNKYVEQIDLNDFIKLYINHRPAFGLNPSDLHHAFRVLCDHVNPNDDQPEMSRETLLTLLQHGGEHMNDYEMADCLSNLLQINNATADLFETMNAEDACRFVENQLPEQVSIQSFMEDLLKMPSQYVDQVIYTLQSEQQRSPRVEDNQGLEKRARSNITTTTTRSTTANSEHS